jgi:alpha-ketoglutarate-dependent taurine dioxygenase
VAIRVQPQDATLGATVDGLKLADLSDDDWAEVHAAFLRHAVLVFPAQHLTREEQVAFGLRFGDLESKGYKYTATPGVAGRPRVSNGVVELSNVDADGRVISDPHDPQVEFIAGNDVWHTDSSYKTVSAKASVLSCIEGPSQGGETSFADMRAAYDALDPSRRGALQGRRAWHSLEWSQALRGVAGAEVAADPTTMEGAWHQMIRRHPETGRESLYIGRHACAIEGMDLAEAQALLSDLLEGACAPPRVIAHRWTPGDVVVWDNRCLLHRVLPWDLRERRVMWHVRIGGTDTEAA